MTWRTTERISSSERATASSMQDWKISEGNMGWQTVFTLRKRAFFTM
jgi:hypothetical protein